MKLIIHADDFGMTSSINAACIELCQLGTLSSVSVMANMPYSEEVKTLLPLNNISLGLHSTFTQGSPLSSPNVVRTLIGPDGLFHNYATMMMKAKRKEINLNEILTELNAQHRVLKEKIGNRLVFIDSHHSIHNKLLPFRNAFIQLGKQTQVPAIRTRQMYYLDTIGAETRMIRPDYRTTFRFGLKKVMANYFYRKRASEFAKVFQVADGMLVEDTLGALNVFKGFRGLDMNSHPGKTYYAVTHPAITIEDLPESNLIEERLAEYEFLKSQPFQDFIHKHPLTHFGDLCR